MVGSVMVAVFGGIEWTRKIHHTAAIILIVLPLILPILKALDINLVHFAIVMTINMEIGLITPPVGLNLYVVQGVRGRGSISEVMVGSVPFVIGIILMIGVLVVFPDLALIFSRYVS